VPGIKALEQRTYPTLARRLTRYPEEEREQIVRFKIFAYEGQLARAEQEITWAKRGLLLLEEMEEPGKPDPMKEAPTKGSHPSTRS
jgi:PadR family transcriptional regulator, regulatory protein AphA